MPRPMRLSATFVKSCRTSGRYGDGRGGHGLSLMVKPMAAGGLSKTWAQRLRLHGKPIDIGLGSYPVVTLEEARQAALENARAARTGIDPIADRRRRAAIPTFREAAERVIAAHSGSWKDGSRTAGIWASRLDQYAYPSLGSLRVDAITSGDVLGVVGPLWTAKRETATKLKSYLNAIFAWAVAEGHRDDNPVDSIGAALPRGGAQRTHLRALPWGDVPGAIRAVRESNSAQATVDCFEFIVLTACRSGEARAAEWSEVDLDARVWTIPASRTKTQHEHRIPLSATSLTVLERARQYSDGRLVFPSPTGRVMSDNTLSKMLRDNGVPSTVHGFRSSFRDWCGETGQPREVAEASLAHQVGNAVERAYARSDMLGRRRELMESWAEAVKNGLDDGDRRAP